MGISSVVFGIILCFFGAKLLIFVFVTLATLGILIGSNMFAYNLIVPVDAPVPVIAVVACSITFVSVLLSRFILEFTRKWAILLVSAWLGIVLALTIMTLIKIHSASMNLLGALIGTKFGYSLCMNYSHVLPVFSASLIGSFFILKGFDIHFKNYPTEEKTPESRKEIAIFSLYLFGLVFFTWFGTHYQLYGCKKASKPKSADAGDNDDF